MSRSSWFEATPKDERQVLALKAVIGRGDAAAIELAAGRVSEAMSVRRAVSAAERLPADDLLERLDGMITRFRVAPSRGSVVELHMVLSSVAKLESGITHVSASVVLVAA